MSPRSAFLLALAPLLLSCGREQGPGVPPPTSGGEEQFSTDGYRIPRDLEDAVAECLRLLPAAEKARFAALPEDDSVGSRHLRA